MTKLKHSIMIRGKDDKNPVADNRASIDEGREAFSHYCAACHGLDGQNTGVPFADRMSPPVPPLNGKQVQSYTDGQLKWVIDNGVSPSGMPGSKGILTEREIWSIVVFVRHLPPAGSLAVPHPFRSGPIIQRTNTISARGIRGNVEILPKRARLRTIQDVIEFGIPQITDRTMEETGPNGAIRLDDR